MKFDAGIEVNKELLSAELESAIGNAFLGISGDGPYCVHLDGTASDIVVALAKETVHAHNVRKRTKAQRERDRRKMNVKIARDRVGLVSEDMTFEEFAKLDLEKRTEVLFYVWQKVENLGE